MRRSTLWLGAITAVLSGTIACSWCECYPGTWPFDGATNVDPEGPFDVVTGGAWDPEIVAMAGVVRLQTEDGDEVDATLEQVDASTLRLWPDAPLPRGAYRLEVKHAEALDRGTSGHYVASPYGPSGSSTTRFEVGGEPQALRWFFDGESDTRLLAFSEPIDERTLDGRVTIGEQVVELEPFDSTGILFVVGEPAEGTTWEDPLTVAPGVLSAAGEPVPSTELGLETDSAGRLHGQPWCNC